MNFIEGFIKIIGWKERKKLRSNQTLLHGYRDHFLIFTSVCHTVLSIIFLAENQVPFLGPFLN